MMRASHIRRSTGVIVMAAAVTNRSAASQKKKRKTSCLPGPLARAACCPPHPPLYCCPPHPTDTAIHPEKCMLASASWLNSHCYCSLPAEYFRGHVAVRAVFPGAVKGRARLWRADSAVLPMSRNRFDPLDPVSVTVDVWCRGQGLWSHLGSFHGLHGKIMELVQSGGTVALPFCNLDSQLPTL